VGFVRNAVGACTDTDTTGEFARGQAHQAVPDGDHGSSARHGNSRPRDQPRRAEPGCSGAAAGYVDATALALIA